MIVCPFTGKECILFTSDDKQCMFEIIPHTEKKPFGTKECAIKATMLLYIKEKKPDVMF